MNAVIGWDVGGANIKAALVERVDHVDPKAIERPFALWREPQRLTDVLVETAAHLGPTSHMAVTMTAELADCFATKREGVHFVLASLRRAFPDVTLWIYGLDGSFHSVEAARERPYHVAAANWLASTTVAARTFADAVFIDVGSTTTDIIPIVRGRVVSQGRCDVARLRSGELVYTGALRTPICAILRSVPLCGGRHRVAAEHFAIAADAHVWLGRIDEHEYTCETPDGRGRSRLEAAARIARMVCADRETLKSDDITAIAESVARAQVQQIAVGIRQVLRRVGVDRPHEAILVGCGRFLARAAARRLGLNTHELTKQSAACATPACAVAFLLLERERHGIPSHHRADTEV